MDNYTTVYTIIKINNANIKGFEYCISNGQIKTSLDSDQPLLKKLKKIHELVILITASIDSKSVFVKWSSKDEQIELSKIFRRLLLEYENDYITKNVFINSSAIFSMISQACGVSFPYIYLKKELSSLIPIVVYYSMDHNRLNYLSLYHHPSPSVKYIVITKVFDQILIRHDNDIRYQTALKFMYYYGGSEQKDHIKKRAYNENWKIDYDEDPFVELKKFISYVDNKHK